MTTRHSSRPPSSMPFPPGTMLAGKYRVERLLGEGGMGWVVVATHLQLEQRVALKFMHTEHTKDHPDAVGRFLREARAAARVQSEHVARVSDVGTLENGAPYLVMEYLEGQDLEQLLNVRQALPIPLVIDYIVQACEGLAEAHAAGIVHRDLKPANLFLARKSDGSVRVKLLDFGISKLTPLEGSRADVGMTSTQALMGSPLYMSPEQLRSSKNVDRRTDIWSMGVILFEMLCSRSPFEADTLPGVCAMIMAEPPPTPRSLRPEIPVALEAVVLRCLEKDPPLRYPDAAALAEALAPFGGAEVQSAAQRVGRVVRGKLQSMPDAPASAEVALVSPVSGVAKTNLAFTQSRPGGKRSPAVPLAIAGGVVVLVAVAVAGVLMTRTRSTPTTVATGATNVEAPTAVTASAAATASATATATATAMVPATATAARPFVPAKPRPTSTKPASTSGFGGRD